jgi:cytochrome c biogenesis protein CcmG/thiol:disulfide interchange protein DsbE
MDSPDPSPQVENTNDTDVFDDDAQEELAFAQSADRKRRLAIFGLVGGFLAVLVTIAAVQWATDSPDTVETLPDVTLTTIDGEEFQLTALTGEPTVVNFFASWCAPCRAELPAFEAVSQQVAGSVAFVGINTTEPDVVAARQLLDDTGVTYQVLFGDDGTVYEDVGALALPTTAFVDADGTIVEVHSGALNQTDLESKISEHFG